MPNAQLALRQKEDDLLAEAARVKAIESAGARQQQVVNVSMFVCDTGLLHHVHLPLASTL